MRKRPNKILIALTSHGDLAGHGATGYFLSEAAHPWHVFVQAGCTVDLVSTAGGEPPVEGVDLSDPVQQAFTTDAEVQRKVRNTLCFADVDPADYDAVLFAGGRGTMWDFPNDPDLARVTRELYEAGAVVSAVCHGPAALVGVTLSDGRPIVEGRGVAAFTDAEEKSLGLSEVLPFFLETRLKQLGADYSSAESFQPHVVVDGHLITGQNPASATPLAKAVLASLEDQR